MPSGTASRWARTRRARSACSRRTAPSSTASSPSIRVASSSTAGDSVFAEFSSVVDAVRCAVEIQEALKTRNDSLEEHRQMHFRVGVNLGDVVVKNEDLLGDGVNVAARLETMAEPGGICISSSVYDQITGKLDLGFQDIGEQTLKNISRPIHVYRVSGAAAVAAPGADRAACSRRPRCPQPAAMGGRRRRCGGDRRGRGVAERMAALRRHRWCGQDDRRRAAAVPPSAPAAEKSTPAAAVVDANAARAQAESDAQRMRSDAEAIKRQAEAELARARADAEAGKAARAKAEADAAAARMRAQAEADAARIRADAESSAARIKSDAEAAARATEAQAAKSAPAQREAEAKARDAVAPTGVAAVKSREHPRAASAASTARGTSPPNVRSTPTALSVTRCASWRRSRTGFCAETTGRRAPRAGCTWKEPFNPTAARRSRRRPSPATPSIRSGTCAKVSLSPLRYCPDSTTRAESVAACNTGNARTRSSSSDVCSAAMRPRSQYGSPT